jgi:uncharacterized protein (DUF4415 family)
MKAPKRLKEFEPGRGYSKENCDAVDSPELTDEELASMRPAREVLPPAFFDALPRRRGPQKTATKVAVSIRLSRDVVEAFKAKGPGWQSRIDETLRASLRKTG